MTRWSILLSVALAVAIPSSASGQATPDFSGTWTFVREARSRPSTSGTSSDISFPTGMVVKQTPTSLDVTMSNVGQQPITWRFTLDSNTVTLNETANTSETGEAAFAGTSLVLRTRRRFSSGAFRGMAVQQFKETWSLHEGVLTVEKSRIDDLFTLSATGVYDRK